MPQCIAFADARAGAGVLTALAAATLVARIGQVMLAASLSRAKNSAGTMIRGICDLCISILAFWAVGCSILFQHDNRFFSIDWHLLFGGSFGHQDANTIGAITFFAVMTSIASGAVVGSVAERSKFFAFFAAPVLLGALIVPLAGSWATSGWLHHLGFTDSAGASWVHLAGGVCAFAAARAVGARDGKYHHAGSASAIPGHNLPMAGMGTLLMLVGWIPLILGSVSITQQGGDPAVAGLNVLMAAAAAGLAALVFSSLRYGKPDILLTFVGLIGGLVAISAAGGTVSSIWAVAIGAGAGVVVPLASIWIDLKLRVDDPTCSVAVHAVGGLWGIAAAGLFAAGGVMQRIEHLGVQLLGAIVIGALSAGCSVAVFSAVKSIFGVRHRELDQFDGIDLAEHDVAAYPDFQQNTIRSYHLREA